MIKFSDIVKANGKFWYIIITCIIVCFCTVFGLTYNKNNFTASTTLIIEKNPLGEQGTPSKIKIESQIKEIVNIITHDNFINDVLTEIKKVNSDLTNSLSANDIKSNLNVAYKAGDDFFKIELKYSNSKDAKFITDSIINLIKLQYNTKYPVDSSNTVLNTLLSTQVEQSPNKNLTYGIIGILIGIVLAEIIITCIMVFDTKVKDSDILKRETDLNILVKLDKVKENK